MRSKDFAALAERLLDDLPRFFVKGQMAASRPIGHVLRGLYFEGSSFDKKSFYVWAFILPLFVPTKQVTFNLGKRLRTPSGGDRWNTDTPNMLEELDAAVKRQALPFLSAIESPNDIVNVAAEFQGTGDPYVQQAIAYAWIRGGQVSRASEELQRLRRSLDMNVAWQREIAERAERLRTMLLSDPAAAQRQMDVWEAETVHNLGLKEFADSAA